MAFVGPPHGGDALARVAELERLAGQINLELSVAKKSRPCSPHHRQRPGIVTELRDVF